MFTDHSHPLRILHMMPDLDIGGGQTLLLQNILATARRQFRHYVCYINNKAPMKEDFEKEGISTLCLDVHGKLSQPVALKRLLRFAKQTDIDLVHTNNTRYDMRFGVALSGIRSLPLVNSLHSPFRKPIGLKRKIERKVIHGAFRKTLLYCIAVSDFVRTGWIDYLRHLGLSEDQIVTINPGIDTSLFPKSRKSDYRRHLRDKLGFSYDTPILVNVGRLVSSKNQRAVIGVFRQIHQLRPNVVLLMVGDGPEREELVKLTKKNGLDNSVKFLGRRNDIPELLGASDIFIFTSKSEGFGIAPLEAMAAQLPVIAYELPTLRQFVSEGVTGMLIPQGNTDMMAKAILCLLESPRLVRGMGLAARKVIEANYAADVVGEKLESVYKAAIFEKSKKN